MTKRVAVVIAAVLVISAVLWAGAGQVTSAAALAPADTQSPRDWLRTEEDVYFCEERQLYICKRTGETVWPTSDPGIWTEDLIFTMPESIRLDDLLGKTLYQIATLSLPPEVLARIPVWLQEQWRATVRYPSGWVRYPSLAGTGESGSK